MNKNGTLTINGVTQGSTLDRARTPAPMSAPPELKIGDKVTVDLNAVIPGNEYFSPDAGKRHFTGRVLALTIGQRGGMTKVSSDTASLGEWYGISARNSRVTKFYN